MPCHRRPRSPEYHGQEVCERYQSEIPHWRPVHPQSHKRDRRLGHYRFRSPCAEDGQGVGGGRSSFPGHDIALDSDGGLRQPCPLPPAFQQEAPDDGGLDAGPHGDDGRVLLHRTGDAGYLYNVLPEPLCRWNRAVLSRRPAHHQSVDNIDGGLFPGRQERV